MNVISLFAGCGGLDLGFEKAGFNILWANEYDKEIHATYIKNHPDTILNTADVRTVHGSDIPVCDGIIGAPPCQSWSEGGKQLGLADQRGKLFLDYIRIVAEKTPKFFVIENVKGLISSKHINTFNRFIEQLENLGYNVYYKLLNAADYGVPQDRFRVFIVGFLKSLQCRFEFPKPIGTLITLQQAIGDIKIAPIGYNDKDIVTTNDNIDNHDTYVGSYDEKFMARNRVRSWTELSFTIQAQARNTPIHPQAPKMTFVSTDRRIFARGYEHLYRRLSIRECARIQTFPDSFHFVYDNICDGYKMVGNAVPPRLAYFIAQSVLRALADCKPNQFVLVGYFKGVSHLTTILRNKLYYIPINKHTSSLIEKCSTPMYLYLYHNNERFMYELEEDSLRIYNASELIKAGFHPHNERYYGFKLSSTKPLIFRGINAYTLEVDKQKKYVPYLTNIEKVLK